MDVNELASSLSSSVTSAKNTPLLFQQQLNTFYKDILNCEITHPPYWAGRVPETFFLRRRKWIDEYEDWGGDEVLDYINFEWNEYAIVRHDQQIHIKKWLNTVDTSDVSKLVNTNRLLYPSWWKYTWAWTLWAFAVNDQTVRLDWHKLYIYSLVPLTTVVWGTEVSKKELFVTEYTLNITNNISSDYVVANNTYRVSALSQYITNDTAYMAADISSGWKTLFVYLWTDTSGKFYQVSLDNAFDFSSLDDAALVSELELTSTDVSVKDIYITPDVKQILYVNNSSNVYSASFSYNDITTLTSVTSFDTELTNANWLGCLVDWTKLYVSAGWWINQFNFGTAFDISTLTNPSKRYDITQTGTPTANDAMNMSISSNWQHIFLTQYDWSTKYYIAQLWFEHAKTLARQAYNSKVNHSFKRNFQSAKWKLLYWGWANDKVNWTAENASYKLTPVSAPSPAWTTNQYAGKYVMLFGWASSSTTGTSQGCVFPIMKNDWTSLTVWMGWDAQPSQTTYWIFDQYWEVLAFIWGDGLYAIHYDWWDSWTPVIRRYESIQASVSVVDADWSNWMMYAILDNGWIVMSASKTNDGNYSLNGWYFAGYMNGSSYLWSISWALRIVPFNDIVVIFTKNWIYVIKKEGMDVLWTTINTYTLDLAFSFLGIHSFHSVCSYNTGIYFLSNKNTFLSLNIEESYYNKYKITTEDLGIDIQQWLDNIKEDDPVSIAINTETIYVTWYWGDKSTIFQFSNYYSFWHRWETKLMIKDLTVDTHETYLWAVAYRYNLTDRKTDEWEQEYEQHLRWFHWEADIFSLKTILYHKLYLWVNTDLSSKVYYKARLSDWLYEYTIPLSNASFLQKASNLTAEKVLGNSILWYQALWWNAEKYIIWTYLSDVDVLEIPLWLTYSLLEIIVSGDFEIGGNIIWALVHEPHLTPYEDVVAYLDE